MSDSMFDEVLDRIRLHIENNSPVTPESVVRWFILLWPDGAKTPSEEHDLAVFVNEQFLPWARASLGKQI